MQEKKETKLEFVDSGVVNITILTHHMRGEQLVFTENWGCMLEPHVASLEQAADFLNDYHMSILRTAWTDEVITTYQEQIESLVEDLVEQEKQPEVLPLQKQFVAPSFSKRY